MFLFSFCCCSGFFFFFFSLGEEGFFFFFFFFLQRQAINQRALEVSWTVLLRVVVVHTVRKVAL
jgi:hypothetical protein